MPEHVARRARRARADADEHRRDALAHQLDRGLVRGRVADGHGNGHEAREVDQRQWLVARPRGGVPMRPATGPGMRRRRARRRTVPGGAPRPVSQRRRRARRAARISAMRRATSSSEMGVAYASARAAWTSSAGTVAMRSSTDAGSSKRVCRPSRLRTAMPPMRARQSGECRIDDGIHGRGEDRDRKSEAAELDCRVDVGRVKRLGAGRQRHVVEAVGRRADCPSWTALRRSVGSAADRLSAGTATLPTVTADQTLPRRLRSTDRASLDKSRQYTDVTSAQTRRS